MTCCRFKELLLVAGLFLFAAACESEPTPPPAAPATPYVTQATVLPADEALRRDVEQYAADMGVDLEEALRRLQYQDDIGELVLYAPGRCPRVMSGNSHGDYLPLWPPDYEARAENGEFEIVDGAGEVIARVGEKVRLGGGAISKNWESAEYRRLHYELPGDCLGPYWIVRD